MLSAVWLFASSALRRSLRSESGRARRSSPPCEQQIEDEVDQVLRPPVREGRLQRREVRRAAVIERDDLAVDDRIGQARGGLGDGLELVGPVEAFARAQGGSAILTRSCMR